MAAAIELSGVGKRYGALVALADVSLTVATGEFTALVGGSGSGKTTLLKTINRLVAPDAGTVRVLGEDVSGLEPPSLRRRIGYVFQEVGLFPHLSVGENIAITPKLLGWDKARIAARVAVLLDLVALPQEVATRSPAALSGGQRQRVGVARALAAEPSLMLMDEPFGALDPLTRDALGADYRALHDRLGLTTVMVTHDMAEAVLLADRIVVLRDGWIVADGTAADLLARTADPDVRALLEAPRRQAERLRAKLGGHGVNERLAAAFALLPEYLGWHVLLSASALALGVLISLPLAVAASRSPRLRWPVLAGASLIQTIPSLALLALFYPLLLALSALSKAWFGQGFSALGFLPSLLALTLYSMLPILRNGAAGILGVDPAVKEAADGVGMTAGQRLFQVELPLAAPVIMAGVRTAAVWTIGAATLSTPVGQTSLGNYIFAGLQTENWVFVLFGCAASAVLALVADQLLGLVEAGARLRRPLLAVFGAVGLAVGVAVAVLPLAGFGKAETYVVGAKNFSEQYILAELMADRLQRAGAEVRRKEDLGSAVAYRALAAGEVDVYVDYSGTLWTNVLGRKDNPGRAEVLKQLTAELKRRDGVLVLGSLGFENAYAFVMRPERARELGVTSLLDLAREAPRLTLGSDLEFLSRPEWKAVDAAYGLRFKTKRSYQPTFMYRALSGGEADVISAFSSDGRIAADKLLILTDPKGAIPPYDAVVLISPKRAGDPRLVEALKPLIGAIPVQAMQAANYSVDRDVGKLTPAEAARAMERQLPAR